MRHLFPDEPLHADLGDHRRFAIFVLSADDLGVQRGFKLSRGQRTIPNAKQLARYGMRWVPYRTLATLYLWQAAGQE